MADSFSARRHGIHDGTIKAVLGPTNTGKTHLAIERLCAHSSGMIGFPLRLLAREVYDRVCAIKGESRVALITGEERIEPKDARWLLCTAEAMPVNKDVAFAALDEVQLAADRERGHIFTQHLLHLRGREETMFLGSATIEPLMRKLVPEAEIVGRPRFSTLRHMAARKLSRIPPRSVIVAFSAEQVYEVAEMLRRFRGGAAVVMGALSPQSRNAQVALFQSGEVDYLVATDAIGMGLNLDVGHVAFAGLSKFDGQRQRRLFPAEMAQIAGRAGRHQRDGTFGCLAGSGGQGAEFTPEEIYAIEEHRFAPLTKLFWRESSPRFDTVASLIGDLEAGPAAPTLASAPEAIDLAVLKLLSSEADIAATLRGPKQIQRFWQVCSLPDFRAQGVEHHARFVARLWQELAHGPLASDYAPRMIAQLDVTSGDIHALQGRIAAIRSWAYIAQRPDWLPAREEMTMRARNVEARLSDALHARLTERFVNRRTSVLMRKMGVDAGLLPVGVEDGVVRVDGEVIGQLDLFKLTIDPAARHEESKLLLAAAERHLPSILSQKASDLTREIAAGTADLRMEDGAISYGGAILVRLAAGRGVFAPQMMPDAAVLKIPPEAREMLLTAVAGWFERQIAKLAPLRRIDVASCALAAGPELRAVLIKLTDGGGILPRADSGVANLSQVQREALRHLQVKLGALDLFVPAMLRAGPLALWRQLRLVWRREMIAPVAPVMHPTLPQKAPIMLGYRRFGGQLLRIDMAEKLILAAHKGRKAGTRHFEIAPDLAISMGLATENYAVLLRLAGFRPIIPRKLPDNAFGPPAPLMWRWVPVRPQNNVGPIMVVKAGAFAALADLVV